MERIKVDLHRVVVPKLRVALCHLSHHRLWVMRHKGDVEMRIVIQHRDLRLELGRFSAVWLELDEIRHTCCVSPFVNVNHPIDSRRRGRLHGPHRKWVDGLCLDPHTGRKRDEDSKDDASSVAISHKVLQRQTTKLPELDSIAGWRQTDLPKS